MTPKRQTSIRLSGITVDQIKELTGKLGITQSELVTLAIDRFYQANITNVYEHVKYAPGEEITIDFTKEDPRNYTIENVSDPEQYAITFHQVSSVTVYQKRKPKAEEGPHDQ